MDGFTQAAAQIIDFALQVITHSIYICLRTFRFGDRLGESLLTLRRLADII
jgi:hypothetical protein